MYTQEKIDENIRDAMQRGRQSESFIQEREQPREPVQKRLDDWKPAPEGREIPRAGSPYPSKRIIEQPEKQYDTWTVEQWQEWAVMVYQAYPEFAKYLPRWITDMIEDIKKNH